MLGGDSWRAHVSVGYPEELFILPQVISQLDSHLKGRNHVQHWSPNLRLLGLTLTVEGETEAEANRDSKSTVEQAIVNIGLSCVETTAIELTSPDQVDRQMAIDEGAIAPLAEIIPITRRRTG